MKPTRTIPRSPQEVYAIWKIGHLRPDDFNSIALEWMIAGLGSNEVACLSSQNTQNFRDSENLINAAFLEIGIKLSDDCGNVETAIKFYLKSIFRGLLDEYSAVAKLIDISNEFPQVRLFRRSDCDECFADKRKKFRDAGSKFMGQHLRIEKLIGLYYSSDNFDKWTEEQDENCRKKIVLEAKRVYDQFYNQLPIST